MKALDELQRVWQRRRVRSSKHPDLRTGYNGNLAMVSDKYIERYFRKAAVGCPSLSNLDKEVLDQVAKNEIKRIQAGRKVFSVVLIACVIYIIAYRQLLNVEAHSRYFIYFTLSGPIAILILEVGLLIPLYRRNYERFATRRLFNLVRSLEKNAPYWNDTQFRKLIALKIEYAARAIEGIPLASGRIAPEVRRELFATSKRKAQAIRTLELWAMKPGPFTFTDLVNRLTSDLSIIAKGEWYNLPDGQYKPKVSRSIIVVEIGIAVLIIAGVVAIIEFASRLGAAAPILATILSAAALALLNRAGLPAEILERYTEAGSKLTSKDT